MNIIENGDVDLKKNLFEPTAIFSHLLRNSTPRIVSLSVYWSICQSIGLSVGHTKLFFVVIGLSAPVQMIW